MYGGEHDGGILPAALSVGKSLNAGYCFIYFKLILTIN